MAFFNKRRTPYGKRPISIRIEPDGDILEAIQEADRDKPKEMRKAVQRRFKNFRMRIKRKLAKEPPVWKGGKRRWNSERQRRAYFATDGFGKGIPYRRRHKLANSWEVSITNRDLEGIVSVENRTPYAGFVEGDEQQLMHQDSNWLYAPSIIIHEFDVLQDQLINDWYDIASKPPKKIR